MATTNDHYAAFISDGHVYLQELISSDGEPRRLHLSGSSTSPARVLSLSNLQPQLLAVSNGPQILVFDILSQTIQSTLAGTGRVIIALNWSSLEPDLLVSGAIDGSVSLWDHKHPTSTVAQNRIEGGVCQAVACSPTDQDVFATAHDDKVVVSRLESGALRTVRTIKLEADAISSLSWHPSMPGMLLAGTGNGRIVVWDVVDSFQQAKGAHTGVNDDSSDGDDGLLGRLDDMHESKHQILETVSEGAILALWLGELGILCLSQSGSCAEIYASQAAPQSAVKLWSVTLQESASLVCLAGRSNSASIAGVSSHGVETYSVPQSVLDDVGFNAEKHTKSTSTHLGKESVFCGHHAIAPVGMRPIPISVLRRNQSSFARTSKQLQHRRSSIKRKRQRGIENSIQRLDSSKQEPSSPPVPTSMTSSLELPKQADDEGSPMPFLSPSVPARKPSPGDFSALDDGVKLPPLPPASFDSSLHSTSVLTQESDDSDDETFVDGMQGSTTLLPGGINVPLPKACAAMFTSTGELLTFFPPKPKVAPGRGDVWEERPDDPRSDARKVARLFPTFGNLTGESQHWDNGEDSGFESASSLSADGGVRPSFAFYPSSFPSQQSWKARFSPTKHSFAEQSLHKVNVSRHNVTDVEALLPLSRGLATKYRIVCDESEAGAAVCRHNASAADSVGLVDVSEIWGLVAMLLEDEIPPEILSDVHRGSDVLDIARQAQHLFRNEALESSTGRGGLQTANTRLNRAGKPFGAAWIVRAIFLWAEVRANMQLLAALSAILVCSVNRPPTDDLHFQQSLEPHTASYSNDYFASSMPPARPQSLTSRPVPFLRTDSIATSNAVDDSPVKRERTSTASSRNPSQPSTPYPDSASSTPPLSLPSFGKQSSRLSASGSASPEHHRSSFSAAAKYYAQSITDKFASYGAYGTSPPGRKTGTSPSNTNVLSTSFPSGSWGKSVSFASTTSTTKASLLSSSLNAVNDDEGYDSEKTVEDLSLPPTPRDHDECIIRFKNVDWFDDDVSGGRKASSLPDDLLPKCRIWCEYYAEQLRCWDLLTEAAELEKVCGTSSLRHPSQDATSVGHAGITPEPASHASKACSICEIKMAGLQSFCPACLHSSHLDCLEGFIVAFCQEDGQPFTCPTGCGCLCADLPLDVAEIRGEEKPKKKASFTDPRRWRARIEGDSW